MRVRNVLLLVGLLVSGCEISPQKKGTVTVAGRGANLLTEKGDQLMDTGIYAKKNVSPEFAEGYEKGLSDETKREFWSMQDAQRWTHFWALVRKP
jgi:hypothetical protein